MASKRFALFTLLCVLVSTPAIAQNPIPNPGFEDWLDSNLVDWITSNEAFPGSVTESSDAHSGSSAVRGDVMEVFPGTNFGPYILSGPMGEGFPTNTQWGALDGFYKLNSVGGDQVLISISFFSELGAVGGGAVSITTPASTYQPFSVPIFWAGADLPDSGVIYAFVLGPGQEGAPPHLGTYFIFDDFSFSEGQPPVCPITLTGDVNGTGDRVTSDIIYLVNFVLKGGAALIPCTAVGDVNCDGNVATSDIIYLVNFVLKGGPAPCDVCSIMPGSWSCP